MMSTTGSAPNTETPRPVEAQIAALESLGLKAEFRKDGDADTTLQPDLAGAVVDLVAGAVAGTPAGAGANFDAVAGAGAVVVDGVAGGGAVVDGADAAGVAGADDDAAGAGGGGFKTGSANFGAAPDAGGGAVALIAEFSFIVASGVRLCPMLPDVDRSCVRRCHLPGGGCSGVCCK